MPTRTVVLARTGLVRAWRALGAVAVGGAFLVAGWGAWTSNSTAADLDSTRAAADVLGQSVDELRAQVSALGAEPVVPAASEQLESLPAATVITREFGSGSAGRDGRDGQVIVVPAPAITLSAAPGRDGTNGTNGVDGAPGAPGVNATSTVMTTVTPAPILLTSTVTETVTPAPVTSTETTTTTEYSTVTVTAEPPPGPTDPGTDVPTGEPTGEP